MEGLRTFISTLTAAVSNCSLYSRDHTTVDNFTMKSLEPLEVLLRESAGLEIMHVENRLVINGQPFDEIRLQSAKLINRLKGMGLSYVKILPGVTFEELKQFIIEIAETNNEMPAFPHIDTGILDVQLDAATDDSGVSNSDIPSLATQQIEMVKGVYHGIAVSRNPDVAILNKIAGNIASAFRKDVNVIALLGRARTREEYTYIHAVNVAALSMFQAENLGLRKKALLYDVGIAALLHDVGKLFIPEAILTKKSDLDEKEWEEMKLHPIRGARYLSSIEGLPPLAVITAFQHHIGFDGKGYPVCQMAGMDQHLCSQIIAISDCFDALRSARPYRKGLETAETLKIMENERGRALNPVLLDNFLPKISIALSDDRRQSLI